jgi:hypothetical protein
LKIFDVQGKEVAAVANEIREEEMVTMRWNAQVMSSGSYFCSLTAVIYLKTKNLIAQKEKLISAGDPTRLDR